ncbi:hypothetical protein RJ640_019876 [Escallonia rubra]|uniref:Transcription factor CBF/NF-Y/archaeal histone domain-containing protein n=1 Tax=Escallonia rubra TaxID=112253 RepID=A0AA88S229_9ASTE|nr:hypothetical protein RJ640_019876 [Escallonia rubra]
MDDSIGPNSDIGDHVVRYNFAGGSGEEDGVIKEQDRLLPIANVGRIMKKILPANAKISKEGKETMQECVSEFISFVTGEASDRCHKEKRKTVNGDDICWAMGTLGFDDYAAPLKRVWLWVFSSVGLTDLWFDLILGVGAASLVPVFSQIWFLKDLKSTGRGLMAGEGEVEYERTKSSFVLEEFKQGRLEEEERTIYHILMQSVEGCILFEGGITTT